MTITVKNGLFVAPIDAPYKDELYRAAWRSDDREWYTDDLERVLPVIDYLSDELQEKIAGTRTGVEASIAIVPSEGFTVPLPDGKTLFGYQLVDIEYILARKSSLLAEDAGMGKSAIMIGVANKLNVRNILLICPAIAKYNWFKKEWPKWSTLDHLSIGVAEGDYWPETDVVIINYDILPRHKTRLQEKVWDYMIVDESHRIKNAEAKRTKMVLGGTVKMDDKEAAIVKVGIPSSRKSYYKIPGIKSEKRVFATATPMNRPRDLWSMAKACDPMGLGKNWEEYHKRYCAMMKTSYGVDTNGADRLPELGARLRAAFMVRHNAEDVLDLPPYKEELFLLPPVKLVISEEENFVHDNLDALLGLSQAMGGRLTEDSSPEDFLKLIGEAILDNVPHIGEPEFKPLFTKFALIRKATGIAKVPYAVDFIREVSKDSEEPVVIFAYHREVMALLHDAFPKAAFIIGGMTAEARGLEVDKFEDGETNEFIGNIDAAGESVTLTRSNLLVFAEMDWRATAMIQARKRIHRITQKRACSGFYLASANSFDAYVADSAFSKMENIKTTMDI